MLPTMRRLTLLVLVLAVVGLGACTSDALDETQKVPDISVYLKDDLSGPQKKDIEAMLRAMPGAATVTFISRDVTYREIEERLKDDPTLLKRISREDLPESFRITMKDRAAFDRAKIGSFEADLRQLPGVEDVHFPCASVEECERRAEADGLLTTGTPR